MQENILDPHGRRHNIIGFLLIVAFSIIQASNFIVQTIGNTNNGLITMAVYIYIIIYEVLINRKIKLSKLALVSILYLLICVTYRYFGISSAAWGNIYLVGSATCCIVLMIFIHNEFCESQKRILGFILLLTYFLDSLYNIHFFSASSYGLSEEYYLKAHNSTALSLVSALLFVLILNTKNRIQKMVLVVLLLVISYLNIAIMARATNIILIIIGFILIYLLQGTDNNQTKRKNIVFIIFIGSLVVIALMPTILTLVINYLPSTSRMKPRLEGLLFLIRGQQYTSYLQGSAAVRVNLILTSFKTWLSDIVTFFFGKGDHRFTHLSIESAYAIGIGGHSDVADVLARYGIIGGGLFFAIYYYTYIYYKGLFKNTGIWFQIAVIYYMYLVRSIFGVTYMPTICCVIYILIPTIPYILDKNRGGTQS